MIPEKFKERMKIILGSEYDSFINELTQNDPIRSFRVNRIKASETVDISAISDGKVPFTDDGYYTSVEKPGQTPQHHSGMIYMQDPSAMSTVTALDIKNGMKILDSCAAPGGKTTQLAALDPGGIIIANEYVQSRSRILQSNVERMGCRNVAVTNLDTSVLAETYNSYFDLVVADAPCSGEGMFRKNDLAVSEWSEENVRNCAARQAVILDNVCKCVKNGGYLLYSTCTFSLEENEMNVASFLDRHGDFRLCKVSDTLQKHTSDGIQLDGCKYDMSLTRRFYPHISKGEGQFIALMIRDCENKHISALNHKEKNSKKEKTCNSVRDLTSEEKNVILNFLRDNLKSIPDIPLVMCGSIVYLCPEMILPKFGVCSCGVAVGTITNGRVVPHHQLFSAYGTEFINSVRLSSSDPLVMKYLAGEEIHYETSAKGWCSIIVDSCALGGGKISDGVIKNHYPKGLRNK